MTPEKRALKNERSRLKAIAHRERRNEAYFNRIRTIRNYGCGIPLSASNKDGVTNSWKDPNSPTGYSQICSYRGVCQSPCNGDC